MVAPEQIPSLAQLETGLRDALVLARPSAERWLTTGVWGDVLRGWLGQFSLARGRLGSEVKARRLPLCEGAELVELARELWADPATQSQKAVGSALVLREVTNTDPAGINAFVAGVIPMGTRIRVSGDDSLQPPLAEATYETTRQAFFNRDAQTTNDQGGGNFQHRQFAEVPVRALATGPNGNAPRYATWPFSILERGVPASFVDTLFDSTLQAVAVFASGGSLGDSDAKIRELARAMWSGRYAPTRGALVAGCLSDPGVRRVAYGLWVSKAIGVVYCADENWGSAREHMRQITQNLYGRGARPRVPWAGWGTRVMAAEIINVPISIEAEVHVANPDQLRDVSDLHAKALKALRSYLDDRPNWWTWRLGGLRSAIIASDRRFVACPGMVVKSLYSGVELTEPAARLPAEPTTFEDGTPYLVHYSLLDGALSLEFDVQT